MTTVSEIFETMSYGPAPESDKQALEWLGRHAGQFGLFIGGRWIPGKLDATLYVINPPTTPKRARATPAGPAPSEAPPRVTPPPAVCPAELADEAGLPAGVLNVVTGDGATGDLIVRHRDIDKSAFTGSTEVGRLIRQATAGSGKKLSLELGGKSPFIVFDDADLDSVVEGVVDAIWLNYGQGGCAGPGCPGP